MQELFNFFFFLRKSFMFQVLEMTVEATIKSGTLENESSQFCLGVCPHLLGVTVLPLPLSASRGGPGAVLRLSCLRTFAHILTCTWEATPPPFGPFEIRQALSCLWGVWVSASESWTDTWFLEVVVSHTRRLSGVSVYFFSSASSPALWVTRTTVSDLSALLVPPADFAHSRPLTGFTDVPLCSVPCL